MISFVILLLFLIYSITWYLLLLLTFALIVYLVTINLKTASLKVYLLINCNLNNSVLILIFFTNLPSLFEKLFV